MILFGKSISHWHLENEPIFFNWRESWFPITLEFFFLIAINNLISCGFAFVAISRFESLKDMLITLSTYCFCESLIFAFFCENLNECFLYARRDNYFSTNPNWIEMSDAEIAELEAAARIFMVNCLLRVDCFFSLSRWGVNVNFQLYEFHRIRQVSFIPSSVTMPKKWF